jgi:hypothetical protein
VRAGAGLALVKLAIELLEGTVADLDPLGIVRPPGLVTNLHHSTLPEVVIT